MNLTTCSDGDLASFARRTRSGIARLEGFLTRLAAEVKRREAAGEAIVAEDVVRGAGELSRARADAVAARAEVVGALPVLGAAIGSGAVSPENADAAAGLFGRLSPTERARLAAHDEDLARRAATEAPETFARHLQGRAREMRDRPEPDGLSLAEREKARSHLSMGRKQRE